MKTSADAPVNAHAVARIRNEDGIVGGGFLVGPDLVATCAHVVADALGANPYSPSAPDAPVQLDFPRPANGVQATRPGDAIVERWVPIAEDGGGDLALLRLDTPPPGVRVPPLRRIERLWDHEFTVLGFPAGHPDGVWSSGLIRGEQGTRWYQLQSTPGEQRIAGGFSGAPVWDAQSGAVVGVTVAADRGDTTTAFLIPIDQVLALDAALMPCPYLGLRPFEEEHAPVFFGRDEEAAALLVAVDRAPVVAVAGPSGAGKSSLVRAGLLPRLRAAGRPVIDLRPTGGSDLTAGLDAAATTPGAVVVMDQFEELAAVAPDVARRVLEQVVRLSGTGTVRAVLTARWAALDQVVTPELMGVLERGTVLVAPMSRGRLREAIVGPAERSPGLVFEPGLVDRILDDAGAEPGQLPLVESLLTEMWDRRDGGRLTAHAYEAAGGVAGAVATHAERAIEALHGEGAEHYSLDAVRRLFTALARPDHGGRFVRQAVPLDQLPPAQRGLVPALADGRLLVVGRSGGGTGAVVELAHQALIDHWPRLRAWLDADRAFLSWRDRVDGQRERWESEGRSAATLLRGATLAEAAQWLPARADDISPAGAEFLRRSRARQRWEVRRWRVVTAVLAVLGLVATTAAVVAVDRRQVLADQLVTATAGTLARESRDRAPNDSVFAARLALAAFRADPEHPQARTALAASYLALQYADAELADVGPDAITRLVAGGDTALAARPPHPVVITGVTGPRPTRRELTDLVPGQHIALSPDGRLLADVLPDLSIVRLRDLTAPGPPRPLSDPGARVAVPRFSPDGGRLMWLQGDPTGTVTMTVRDLRSGATVPHRLGPLPADTLRAWLTPDPNLVVLELGREDVDPPEVRLSLRSLVDGTEVAPLPPRSAVALGGAAVVSCTGDGSGRGSTAIVDMIGSSAPPSEFPSRVALCEHWLTADREFLVGRPGGEGPERDRVEIIDLRTGTTRESFLPVGVLGDIVWPRRLTAARGVAVARTPDGPAVLAEHHGSVLRLRTRHVLPEQGDVAGADLDTMRSVSEDGRYAVSNPGGALVVEDLSTGLQVAALPGAAGAGPDVGTEVRVLYPEPSGWTLTRYEIPTLRRIASFPLPVSADPVPPRSDYYAGNNAAVGELKTPDEHQLLTLSDGLLAALDPQTGRPLAPPTALGDTPEERRWFQRATSMLRARPGHPGQAVVLGMDGGLQLWDAVRGERLRTVPTAYRPANGSGYPRIAIDRDGRRMAVVTPERAIEVWDLDSGALTGPAIPARGVHEFAGFDADGHLVADVTPEGGGFEVRLIDVDEHRETARMTVHSPAGEITGDGRNLRLAGFDGSVPELVPLSATVWRDELCAVVARPFTPAEAAVLPQDVDLDPPCS